MNSRLLRSRASGGDNSQWYRTQRCRSQPCLRRCRIEQPVTSTAADYRLPAPQFLGRQPMLEINGLTGRVTDQKTEEPVARPAEARIKRGRGGGPTKSTGKNAYSTRTASRTVRQTVRASIARRGARLRADHQPTLCRTLLRDCCAAFSVFGGSKGRRIPETLPHHRSRAHVHGRGAASESE